MLQQAMTAVTTNDRSLAAQVSHMDKSVDRLDNAIKLYLTKLTRGSLDEHEGRRAMEIITFAINLKHVGDIVDKNLSELASKKIKRRLQFSPEGAAELAAFHQRVLESLRAAFGVFMSGNVNEARRLLADKAELRATELAATERHLDRLREAARRPSRQRRCTLTCCATSSASTHISAPWPILFWKRRVNCRNARQRKMVTLRSLLPRLEYTYSLAAVCRP